MTCLLSSIRAFALAAACLVPNLAGAGIVEEIVRLPVALPSTGESGTGTGHEITLTIFRDDERVDLPFLILNHGRAGSADARARFGRSRYAEASRWFVDQGFAVFLPTRLGYGVTGGPDLEHGGGCAQREFAPGFAAAADQSEAVVAYAKSRPYVRADQGLLVGQSYGGATTLALLARNIEGVLGGLNFAGGSGGNPVGRPENPCSPEALGRLFAAYAATSRRPSLWLYAQNDRYWGTRHPQRWFAGYRAAGGLGEHVLLPAHGEDGHASFTRNPQAWQPHAHRFIRALGLPGGDTVR